MTFHYQTFGMNILTRALATVYGQRDGGPAQARRSGSTATPANLERITMSWFNSIRRNAWDTGQVPVPWETDRPAIYRFVEAQIDPDGGGLTEHGQTLPDEEIRYAGEEMRWVAGGLDGAFHHHGGGGGDAAKADAVFAAVRRALDQPDLRSLQKLYTLLVQDDPLDYLDPLLQRLSSAGAVIHIERLGKLGRFLAENAPDRGPVKFGIVICGGVAGAAERSLFRVLGQHEEFTFHALGALITQASLNGDDYPEQEIWDLAQRVHGWGRIHAVERLAKTQDPGIKAWLLREGFRNEIMNEYLAYTAATSGGLLDALKDHDPDAALLDGAGEIIHALIEGGPAENIDNYEDGAEAITLYLDHLRSRARSLSQLLAVASIHGFLDSKEDWQAYRDRGWTEDRRRALSAMAEDIAAQPHWRGKVTEGLEVEDDTAFWTAQRAALVLGIDSWEHEFERQRTGRSSGWTGLMHTDDPGRIERVVALAEEQIPLDQLATGPEGDFDLGPLFEHHLALEFIVQALGRFSGKGWSLVRAALASPLGRNRLLAIRALSEWGRENWPADADAALRGALERETDTELSELQRRVLAGQPIPED